MVNLKRLSLEISIALAKESRKSLTRFFNGKRTHLGRLTTQKGLKQYYKKYRIRKIIFNIKHKVR